MDKEKKAEIISNYRAREGDTGSTEVQVALLTALACSDPPEGNAVWTMQLLADRLVELGEVESISHDTVGRVLKKTEANPG